MGMKPEVTREMRGGSLNICIISRNVPYFAKIYLQEGLNVWLEQWRGWLDESRSGRAFFLAEMLCLLCK